MTKLYWTCNEDRFEELLPKLEAYRFRPSTEDIPDLFELDDPSSEIVFKTLSLIRRGDLRTAGIFGEPLSPPELWIAREWWRKLVADEAGASGLPELGPPGHRHQTGDRTVLVFELSQFEGPFGARRASAHDVRENLSAYYGDLADPEMGGAVALFAAGEEAARANRLSPDEILVGGPEAFGFSRDQGSESTIAWRRKGVIAVHAVGFGLNDWDPALGLLADHQAEARGYESLAREWRAAGYSFGLAIVLKGLQDPPVVIPMGSVYQQPAVGSGYQNLAAAQSANVMVAAGATVPVIVPAYCLNPSFSPPSGPMAPTPLVYGAASGDQSAVWDGIRRRYGEAT